MRDTSPQTLSFLAIILLFCLVVPASATITGYLNDHKYETFTWIKNGTFERPGSTNGIVKDDYAETAGYADYQSFKSIDFVKLENYPLFYQLQFFTAPGHDITLLNTTSNGTSSACTAWTYASGTWNKQTIGTGTCGYSRSGTTGEWYVFSQFPSWSIGSLTGYVKVNLTWDVASWDLNTKRYLSNFNGATEECVAFGFTDVGAGPPVFTVVSDDAAPQARYIIWSTDYWRNDYYVFSRSGDAFNNYVYIVKDWAVSGGSGNRYNSQVKINATYTGVNSTLLLNISNTDETVGIIKSYSPIFIEDLNSYDDLFWDIIYTQELDLTVQVDKGETCSDRLAVDTATTARLYGSQGDGLSYVQWKWSENFDDLLSGSSHKNDAYAYVTYGYNSTNTSATGGGNWELFGYGFDEAPITTTSTTRGVYTWSEVKNQQIRFNWSAEETSWEGSGLSYPYNYVQVNTYDDDLELIGSAEQSVCVMGPIDKAVFYIFIYEPGYTKRVLDANVYLFDHTAGVWELNGVNATYGSITREVNTSHAYYLWSSKAGFTLLEGLDHPGMIHIPLVNGCVTISAPMPGVTYKYSLVMMNTVGNATVPFTVQDYDGKYIPNVKITITNTSYGIADVIYTGSNGQVTYTAITNTHYAYTAEYNGDICYDSVSKTFNTYTSTAVHIVFLPCGVIPTVTVTPTPTPTPTIEPGEGAPEVCASKNPIDAFRCLFYSAGATGSYAGLMLALVICAALAFLFGYYISFQASLIGAFVGFVFSLAFGLIPIWLLIAMIFIGSIFMMGRWWYGAGGG